MSLQTGDTIGDYQVLGVLGQGGMGAVYRVRNLLSDREEAMKVVLPEIADSPESADRFLREIKVQASLQHPHIAALRTAVRVDGRILMIMELIDGVSLAATLRSGRMPLAAALRIADDVLGALAYAHAQGVIHRDIKPANILVDSRGAAKLTDFGVARALNEKSLTITGLVIGSLHYMSPEQIRSQAVDFRSDLYSLGVTLYEMLTGRKPIEGNSEYEIMHAHVEQIPAAPADLVPGLPGDVSRVVQKAIAKAPGERFQTATAFQSAIRDALAAMDNSETRGLTVPARLAEMQPPGSTPLPGTGIDTKIRAKAESRLAEYLGPIAKNLVARAAPRHSDAAAFGKELAEHIPDPKQREKFLTALGVKGAAQPNSSTGSGSGAGSGSRKGSPITEAAIEAAGKALAVYMGPMARVLAARAAKRALSIEELKESLAAEIPGERDRQAFLKSF